MASLIEELITVLDAEDKLYKELVPIAEKKTETIINNDLQSLESITDEEQLFVSQISKLEKKRQEVINNIAIVMNKKVADLNFKTILSFLNEKEEREKLSRIHDSMNTTLERLAMLNDRNKILIEQSLEMIEFEMNLVQSLNRAPGVGNYNTSKEFDLSSGKAVFDTKR